MTTRKNSNAKTSDLKVALVCDWLTNVGGAEKVLLEIHQLFPNAPIYTSQYNPKKIDWFKDADVRVGWMKIFPSSLRRFLGVFRDHYFSHLDLSDYDLVISVTGAEAKAVKAKYHISYCHVPTQYYWQMYDKYVEHPGFGILNPLVRFCFKVLVRPLRRRDYDAAQRVDQFVTISNYARDQIKKYYHRDSIVVHPPVDVELFGEGTEAICPPGHEDLARAARSVPEGHIASAPSPYITTSRQVTWKRLDLCIKACLKLKKPLLIIGEGPEHKNLVKLANGSDLITFLPLQNKTALAKYLASAKGYLFPSLEPFGIAPVEALSAGCPVIAFKEGGAKDYVKDGENGILFEKQTVASLADAIERFEKLNFNRKKVSKTAENFSPERFDQELLEVIRNAK